MDHLLLKPVGLPSSHRKPRDLTSRLHHACRVTLCLGVAVCCHNTGAQGTAAAPSSLRATVHVNSIGMPMVRIPAGEFLMGDSSVPYDGNTTERPVHAIYVDTFYMDRTEVTNQ